MKTRYLPILLLTLVLFLGAAPTAYTAEPPNTPDDPDDTYPLPVGDSAVSLAEGIAERFPEPLLSDWAVGEPVESQGSPTTISTALSTETTIEKSTPETVLNPTAIVETDISALPLRSMNEIIEQLGLGI